MGGKDGNDDASPEAALEEHAGRILFTGEGDSAQ